MKLSSSTVFSLTVLDVGGEELEKAEQQIQHSEGDFLHETLPNIFSSSNTQLICLYK